MKDRRRSGRYARLNRKLELGQDITILLKILLHEETKPKRIITKIIIIILRY